MKIPLRNASSLTTGRQSTRSTQGAPKTDSAESRQVGKQPSTAGDTFQKAQGASIFGQQMGSAKAKGLGSHALNPNSLAFMVMTETMQMATSDRAASKSATTATFTAKISALTKKKGKTNEAQAMERNRAWVNVGVAVATAVTSLVKGVAVGSSAMGADSKNSAAESMAQSLGAVASQLNNGDTAGAMATWGEGLKTALPQGQLDINSLIQQVIRQSYMETNKDLQFYAEKVKHFNETKKEIREQMNEIREKYSGMIGGTGEIDGNARPSLPPDPLLDPDVLKEQLADLEDKLQTAGDDSQLANIDLQEWLQKQQQSLQLLSNVSKALHDSAMAVARKIG